ncbi:MAG: sigma-54-dependent Fis family transcriptional regulator [Nitrospirae bacterium]|nr:sigma-54-dependent Fis family transcriptional regulator [Nitrospirota bacterium]
MHKIKRSILIVDDDRNFCMSVAEYLKADDTEVSVAHTARECLDICSKNRIDLMLLDQQLPDAEGYTLCPAILNFNTQTKIIFTTAFPSFDNAVKAVRAGAFDYLSKPFELEELGLAMTQALRILGLEKVEQFQNYCSDREREEHVPVGQSRAIADIHRLIKLAANADAPVLITGETGSGKNVAARSIHYGCQFRQSPFISINCAALPESLIEAELFGYEKGAFTGAVAMKKGMFEMAEGGTIFLDEIGEMPMALQAKLLGVLDDGTCRRLGGTTPLHAQVRVIAATSVDLEKAIKARTFREDLYYRLGVIKIHLPPLRERREDIPALCDVLITKVAKGRQLRLAEGQIEKLMQYDWPGNVRELRNILERAAILQQGAELQPAELLAAATRKAAQPLRAAEHKPAAGSSVTLDDIEKNHILAALTEHAGNLSRAARAVGISLSTLKRKLKKYNYDRTNE